MGTAFERCDKRDEDGSIELIENIGLTQTIRCNEKFADIDISNGIDLTNNVTQREAFIIWY